MGLSGTTPGSARHDLGGLEVLGSGDLCNMTPEQLAELLRKMGMGGFGKGKEGGDK
jgi:hypothetical protein